MKNNWLAWTSYILMRLAVFLVPFLVLFAIGLPYYLAAAFAAVIGLSLSILFLSKQRNAASETIYERRKRKGKVKRSRSAVDADEEDALIDAASEARSAPDAESTPEARPDPDSEGESHSQ